MQFLCFKKKVLIIDNRRYHAKSFLIFSFYIYVCINILFKKKYIALCGRMRVCLIHMGNAAIGNVL